MGVIDDTGVTATAISTADQVINLRRGLHTPYWRDSTFTWSPVDRSKWYYVNPENANGDARWTVPGELCYISDISGDQVSLNIGVLDVQYELEFSGATIVAA
jgi:hypothetical protein